MGLFTILWWIIIGFVVGLIARAIMPGDDNMGIFMTAALGIAGSFLGGFISSLLFRAPAGGFHAAGFIGSLIGALILLGLVRFLKKSSA
jgi:uncharacterized membrane protein YeaQ/YmgE (transglycosylase-associated protein family)